MTFHLPTDDRQTGKSPRGSWCCLGSLLALQVTPFLEVGPSSAWIETGLTLTALAAGWPVLVHGLVPWLVELRPTRETLPALASTLLLLASALALLLWIDGRLPGWLARPDGSPRLLGGGAVAVLAAGLLERARRSRAGTREGTGPTRGALLTSAALATTAAGGWALLGGDFTTVIAAGVAVLVASTPGLDREIRAVRSRRCRDSLEARGIALESEEILDHLARANALCLARAGVLTARRPRVTALGSISARHSAEEVMRLAAAAEFGARDPLASAILERQQRQDGTVPGVKGFQALPSEGVRAFLQGHEILCGSRRFLERHGCPGARLDELDRRAAPSRERGDTVLFVAREGTPLGWIEVRDPLRPEAVTVLSEWREQGLAVSVLSGDHESSLRGLLAAAGGVDARANLPPSERGRVVAELARSGARVVVVADPVSGSEALREAAVGIEWHPEAPPSASPRPPRVGQVVVVQPVLTHVAALLREARELRRSTARQRLLAMATRGLVLPLVAGGLRALGGPGPSPLLAAIFFASAHFLVGGAGRRPVPYPPARGGAERRTHG